MKKYISIAFMAAAVTGLVSCDMDSPSQSSLDAETVYSNVGLAESAVIAINDAFGATNDYRGRFIRYYGINTDIEWCNTPTYSGRETGKYDATNYDTEDNNDVLNMSSNTTWEAHYTGIEKANVAIKNLRQYGGVDDPSNSDMRQLLGEALTLRAVLYMDLIKAYGDVPERFDETTNDNIDLPRTDRDTLYKALLADLLEAEDYVAWPNATTTTSTTERVSLSFVKGLRARMALWAGGYSLRDDNGTGVYRLSNDPDLTPEKMYAIAKQECIDVINSGAHPALETLSFEQNFRNLCTDVYTAGQESIWEVPFSSGRGQYVYCYGPKHGNTNDQFLAYSAGSSLGGQNGPVPTFFYDFDVDDIRRDITCVPYGWSEDLDANGNATQELAKVTGMYFGKVRYEWMSRTVNSQDDGVNFQYMRLSDIYLMAAEAVNQIDGPSAAAQYLKPVLDRALPAAKVTALMNTYTASKDAFQQGIIDQRAFELAGEHIRKQDLIRWGIIDQKLSETKEKLTRLQQRTGEYADLPDKLYYLDNGDNTITIYGLNHGETDTEGKNLKDNYGYEDKGWLLSNGTSTIEDDVIDGLYVVTTPSLHCLWPIPRRIITNSNNMLNNDFLGK